MSNQRRFTWKSGRLSGTPLTEFWQLPRTLDAADPQIPNLPLEGSGGITGTGAYTFGALTVAGTAVRGHPGAGAFTFAPFTVAGIAKRGHPGSGAVALPALTVSGAGNVQSGATGSGAFSFPAFTAAGVGKRGHPGTGAVALPAFAASGAGQVGRSGAGAVALPGLVVSGAGKRGILASGAVTLPALQAAGQAKRTIWATGSIQLPALQASGQAPEPPPPVYQYRDGTAFDIQGRMITQHLVPGSQPPAPRYILGLAHAPMGMRYVTSGVGPANRIDGFALAPWGVQLVAAAGRDKTLEGLPTLADGTLSVSENPAVEWVNGIGITVNKRVAVTDAGP